MWWNHTLSHVHTQQLCLCCLPWLSLYSVTNNMSNDSQPVDIGSKRAKTSKPTKKVVDRRLSVIVACSASHWFVTLFHIYIFLRLLVWCIVVWASRILTGSNIVNCARQCCVEVVAFCSVFGVLAPVCWRERVTFIHSCTLYSRKCARQCT